MTTRETRTRTLWRRTLTVGSAVARNLFWRSLMPSDVSSTVMTGNPIFKGVRLISIGWKTNQIGQTFWVQFSMKEATSSPDASEMPFQRSGVFAFEYKCALR